LPQPTVSSGLVSALLNYVGRRGADAAVLRDSVGVAIADIEDPDARLPFIVYADLMRAAQVAADDPALALHLGEDVDDGSARQRFELAQADSRLLLVDRRENPNAFPELTESAFARLVCGPRRFLERPHVLSVRVTHPAPSYRKEYERIFQCPVYFQQDLNALELVPGVAQWRVARNPRYVFGLLLERAERLLSDLELSDTVRGLLEARLIEVLHQGDVRAETIAADMGLSRQTLFRKLKEEGASFAGVLEDLRRRLAIEYLRGRRASVHDTAYLVGFSDPAAFSRAFKRWTGRPPGAFRSDHRSS